MANANGGTFADEAMTDALLKVRLRLRRLPQVPPHPPEYEKK